MKWFAQRVRIYPEFNVFPNISVSSASCDLVDLCPNLWWNNYRDTLFLGIRFCGFEFSFVYTKNACFCCALCGDVTTLSSLSPKKTVQNNLWKSQVCTEFISVIMENNQSHKSGANSMIYNIEMKGLSLSSSIFISTYPVCFAVTKFSYATSIYFTFPPMSMV